MFLYIVFYPAFYLFKVVNRQGIKKICLYTLVLVPRNSLKGNLHCSSPYTFIHPAVLSLSNLTISNTPVLYPPILQVLSSTTYSISPLLVYPSYHLTLTHSLQMTIAFHHLYDSTTLSYSLLYWQSFQNYDSNSLHL